MTQMIVNLANAERIGFEVLADVLTPPLVGQLYGIDAEAAAPVLA